MAVCRHTCALVLGALALLVASSVQARVGVAPVAARSGVDERLRRTVEQAVLREVVVQGHEVLPPDAIDGRFRSLRSQTMPAEEWAALARALGLSAIVVTRLEPMDAGVRLVAGVVLADGTPERSGNRDVGRADAAKSAAALVSYLLGPCVDRRTCTNELRGTELALGRDLDRDYLRYQQRGGGGVRSYLRWRLRLERHRLARGWLAAGFGAPLVALTGGGLAIAIQLGLGEEEFAIYAAGLGIGGMIALLAVGGTKISRSRRNIPRLERALERELPDDSTKLRFGLLPFVGPDGQLGAGAVVYF
jgi:hypothetical protein